MTKLTLIRHGETDWNLRDLVQGSTDVPLNETGVRQAESAAAALVSIRDEMGWGAVVTSTLSRARATGEIIAKALELPLLSPIADLVERSFGDFEGEPVARAKELYPNWDMPGAEPEENVFDRSMRSFEKLRIEHEMQPLIVVAHGGLIRNFVTRVSGFEFGTIANASINLIEHDGESWKVRIVNGDPFESFVTA